MEQLMLQEAIMRIGQMEQCFDALQNAAGENLSAVFEEDALKALLSSLTQYYESGQWLRDYELDEKGLLPKNLKRGVLSQDAVYDFLERLKNEESEKGTD